MADPCRYVAGLPHAETRPLTEHDRLWLERRLRRLAIGMVLAGLGIAAVLSTSVLSTMLPAAAPPLHGIRAVQAAVLPPALLHTLHGGLGLGLAVLGGVGVLACLATPGWWRRLAVLGTGAVVTLLAIDTGWPELAAPRWLTAELLVATAVLGLSHLGLHLGRRAHVLWHARTIRADLDAGLLDRFEAPRLGTPTGSPTDEMLTRLHRAGYVDREGEVLRLEVLPRSGLVVRASGRRVERWETAHVAQVAPAQPHALRVALPRGVAPATPDPRLCLRRRSLTPQERAELQRHIVRLRRRWWPAAVLTVVVLLLVYGALPLELSFDGASLGWLALLVLAYVGYGRRVLAARKLEHDRHLRWVVTVHQEADSGCDPPSLEVLPISQLAWTEHATPAGWRSSRL